MDELIAFYGARLGEDESAARETRQASLSWQNFDMDGELRDDKNAGTVAYIPHAEDRAHIARHDPARVFREVKAGRELIKLCQKRWTHDLRGIEGGLEMALELAVYKYADHPDYDASWTMADG